MPCSGEYVKSQGKATLSFTVKYRNSSSSQKNVYTTMSWNHALYFYRGIKLSGKVPSVTFELLVEELPAAKARMSLSLFCFI